jgi:2-polyprenyl-3-methyl-5-hydroxy-6-metoxy-1,4-benzoquinol methylase
MRRKVIPELLDEDLGTPEEIASSLEDLRIINQRFGGTTTTVDLLRRVAAQTGLHELSLLEVAAGAGDMAIAVRSQLANNDLALAVVLLDRMESHLNGRQAQSICGEAARLPFRDRTFDVVSCSLFVHHLEPDEVRQFVSEGLRVARRAVLINDLIRSWLHLALVYAGLPSFRSRITRHDAPASVRRAYTIEEMRRLLCDLPATKLEISKHHLYRMGVLVWKNSNEHLAFST